MFLKNSQYFFTSLLPFLMLYGRRLLLELQVPLNILTGLRHLILFYLLDLFFHWLIDLSDVVHELIKRYNKH